MTVSDLAAVTDRRCDRCGALGSDLATALILDETTGEVVHVRGFIRCGVLVTLESEPVGSLQVSS